MNFFKSVFSEEPGDPNPTPESVPKKQHDSDSISSDPNPNLNSNPENAWGFGTLMKTLSTKSESVMQTYSRDLMEFGSGLRKEIEVAQGSLGNVGHAFDEFGNAVIKGTTQIISQGKEGILATDHESDSSESNRSSYSSGHNESLRRYSRFHAQLRAVQGDVSTYCEEPEDLEDYVKWKSGFVLEDKKQEIDGLFDENPAMESVYKRVVPSTVDHETFWCRYFYKVHKLKQTENVRAKLKQAISAEEEELSWDVDISDTNEEGESVAASKLSLTRSIKAGGGDDGKTVEETGAEKSHTLDPKIAGKEGDKGSVVKETNVSIKKEMGVNHGKQTRSEEFNNGNAEESVNSGNVGKKSIADSNSVKMSEKISDVSNYGKETSVPLKADGSEANKNKEDAQQKEKEESSVGKSLPGNSEIVHGKKEKGTDAVNVSKERAAEAVSTGALEKKVLEGKDSRMENKELVSKSDKKVASEIKDDCEEDFGWDEIEDLSSIDDNKATHDAKTNRTELRKKLNATEEEEDLSWDIEDGDD